MPIAAADSRGVRLDSLTSIRFVAAFLVLAHHEVQFFASGSIENSFTDPLFVGVQFFFVLSGFILMWTHADKLQARYFYGRRFARIYPLHLAFATFAAIVLLVLGEQIQVGPAIANLSLVHAWWPTDDYAGSLDGASWSLSCEAFFYLCFPLIARLVLRLRASTLIGAVVAWTIVAGVLAAILWPSDVGALLYKGPWFRIGPFIIGAVVGHAMKQGWRPKFSLRSALWCGLGTYVLFIALPYMSIDPPRAFYDLASVPAILMVLTAAASRDLSGVSRWTRAKFFVLLGEASFALYLLHYPVLELISGMIPIRHISLELSSASPILAVPLMITTAFLCIGLSIVVYRFFERPMERILRNRLGMPPVSGHPKPAIER